jgi:hypothetical protein
MRLAGEIRAEPSKKKGATMNAASLQTTPMPTDPMSSFSVRITLALSRAPQ